MHSPAGEGLGWGVPSQSDDWRKSLVLCLLTWNVTMNCWQDYGSLFCIGENSVGVQSAPCQYQIVPTGDSLGTILSLTVLGLGEVSTL